MTVDDYDDLDPYDDLPDPVRGPGIVRRPAPTEGPASRESAAQWIRRIRAELLREAAEPKPPSQLRLPEDRLR